MDNTFIEIKNEGFVKLSKLNKIKKFNEECLQNPAVSEMCKTAFSFIIKYMTNHSSVSILSRLQNIFHDLESDC